jgi:hypothetical protein
MPQSFGTITTIVRRKGGLDVVTTEYAEKCTPENVFSGDRRSRQISRRHWLRQTDSGWCSSGDYWNKTATNHPFNNKGG